jgi:glycosyltransferase involved in cell wall biosynthesis
VCKVAGKALYENAIDHREEFAMYSKHDPCDGNTQPYLPSNNFKGFGGQKNKFIRQSIKQGSHSKVVILSHINLLLAGYLIKLASPKTKVVLIAHGIEVWRPLTAAKKKMLRAIDKVVAVSKFTREKLIQLFGIPGQKLEVINNALDPFLLPPQNPARRSEFRSSYGYTDNDIVLMTLSRLSATEQEKNYDKVLIAIKKLHVLLPQLKYVFVGKYDEEEKSRIEGLAGALGIEYDITFTGFVPDSVIADYYNMADIYIMPSEKEGFGISFIEAMYYNKPVIAGNRDGTTDALADGRLGVLVDPQNQQEITAAIQRVATGITAYMPDRKLLLEKFSFDVYKKKWETLIAGLTSNELAPIN